MVAIFCSMKSVFALMEWKKNNRIVYMPINDNSLRVIPEMHGFHGGVADV